MLTNPWEPTLTLRDLSDEAVVEILDFLQRFTTDFENRYADQIHRYYAQRSRHNIVTHPPGSDTDTDTTPF